MHTMEEEVNLEEYVGGSTKIRAWSGLEEDTKKDISVQAGRMM